MTCWCDQSHPQVLRLQSVKPAVHGMRGPAPLLLLLTTSLPPGSPRTFLDWPAALGDLVGGGATVRQFYYDWEAVANQLTPLPGLGTLAAHGGGWGGECPAKCWTTCVRYTYTITSPHSSSPFHGCFWQREVNFSNFTFCTFSHISGLFYQVRFTVRISIVQFHL